MQVLGSRRGGLVTLVIAGVAFLAAAAFAVLQLVQRPDVAQPLPAPGSAIAEPRPEISFEIDGSDRVGELRVMLDGRDVTARARGADGRVSVRPGADLAEGSHAVQVQFTSGHVFARSGRRAWDFDVDTTAPALAVAQPKPRALRARRAVAFAGTAEVGSRVTVAYRGGETQTAVGPDGRWRTVARLPEGLVAASVTAVDRAGNTTERTRRLVVDTIAPTLAISAPAKGEQLTETDQPLVYGAVRRDDPRHLTFTATVNGKNVATAKGADAASADDADTGYAQAAGLPAPPLELDGRRFAMSIGALPQGRNRITVSVRDRAGNVARSTRIVRVDSTEEFGPADIGPGARGADVVELQKRLKESKVLAKRAKLTGVVDKRTVGAIKRYQKRYGIPVTGVVDERTRTAMVGRLVVNLSQFRIRLIRNGKVWKSYPIAIGQPAYPTPTGDYEINDKQVDPTWYPPDSPWAAELATIPPGPGNPLGTRWIGTTAPAIGIHGTYASSSVGTAASHGCMRMHIPDVEELYEHVTIGMKISIRP